MVAVLLLEPEEQEEAPQRGGDGDAPWPAVVDEEGDDGEDRRHSDVLHFEPAAVDLDGTTCVVDQDGFVGFHRGWSSSRFPGASEPDRGTMSRWAGSVDGMEKLAVLFKYAYETRQSPPHHRACDPAAAGSGVCCTHGGCLRSLRSWGAVPEHDGTLACCHGPLVLRRGGRRARQGRAILPRFDGVRLRTRRAGGGRRSRGAGAGERSCRSAPCGGVVR